MMTEFASGKTAGFFLLVVIASFIVFTFPLKGLSEIYKWTDEKGNVHFTDNIMNVPEKYRNKIEKPELPEINTYEEPALTGSGGGEGEEAASRKSPSSPEDLEKQISQLEAEIQAKKDLIKMVEERQNLALNPLRNRVIDPDDLKLYEKYKKELPQDEQRLQELKGLLGQGEETPPAVKE
ncbi:MAG: DUF4124 domain-containing protein [Deltaproteobacteria bacterium]|nr:MAG: DUF4124 domain-containing protein [Deltaproteobacteria bacterium]